MHPSPSATAYDGNERQDDAVALLPGWCLRPDVGSSRSPPNRSVQQSVHECGQFPLDRLGESRRPQLPDGGSQTGREGNQIAVLAKARMEVRRGKPFTPVELQGCVFRPLCEGDARSNRDRREATGERSHRSTPVSWAWLDLNQRPHPYQVSRAKRCAERRFPPGRWRASGAKGCVFPTAPLRPGGGAAWARRSELIGRHVEHGTILDRSRSGGSSGHRRAWATAHTPLDGTWPGGRLLRGQPLAGDCDVQRVADLKHPFVAESADALDERPDRHARLNRG